MVARPRLSRDGIEALMLIEIRGIVTVVDIGIGFVLLMVELSQ